MSVPRQPHPPTSQPCKGSGTQQAHTLGRAETRTSSGYESDPVGTALQRSPHRERLHARQHAKGAARVITAGRGPSRPSSPVGFPPAGHTTQHVFAPARSAGRKAGQQGEQAHVRQQLGSGGTDGVRIPVQRHGCRHAAHTSHATKRTVGGGVRACLHASPVPSGAPGAAPSTHNPHPPVPGSGGTDGMQTPVRRHRCRHATHTRHATSRTVGEGACMSTCPYSTLRRGTRS